MRRYAYARQAAGPARCTVVHLGIAHHSAAIHSPGASSSGSAETSVDLACDGLCWTDLASPTIALIAIANACLGEPARTGLVTTRLCLRVCPCSGSRLYGSGCTIHTHIVHMLRCTGGNGLAKGCSTAKSYEAAAQFVRAIWHEHGCRIVTWCPSRAFDMDLWSCIDTILARRRGQSREAPEVAIGNSDCTVSASMQRCGPIATVDPHLMRKN